MDSELAGVTACDVLIVGSGAAALCAAITAREAGLDVLVAEKTEVFGGTSAWSGGWLWIPQNPLAERAGIVEDPEAPRRYLRALLGNRIQDPRIEAFLHNGPEMVAFLEEIGAMTWVDGNKVPDFYDHDGAVTGGRSVTAAPFNGRTLGPLFKRLRPPRDILSLWGMGINSGADMAHFFQSWRSPSSIWHISKRLSRHVVDLVLRGRGTQLVGGNALVAHLLKAAQEHGVTLWHSCPVTGLISEDGRVIGAHLTRGGKEIEVRAKRGVILAAGGFPHDAERQKTAFAHSKTIPHASAAPTTNTGDGLRLAEGIGGEVDTTLAEPAAWAPVSRVPDGKGGFKNFPHLVDRAKPGFIAVDRRGKRFVNEANSYHEFMKALFAATPAGQAPEAWLICDHRAQRQFGIGWAKPFPFPLGPFLRSGYLKRGRTLNDLAAKCNLPSDALESTVQQFNTQAREGRDPAFHRGETPYNRASGWAKHRGPNPSLRPLDQGPFYAVKLVPGSLGTFAGIKTAANGQVLSTTGAPIDGLYAIGNDAASIMGGHYPSGGITLGPGMTFGYVVGRRLAGLPVSGLETNIPTHRKDA
ncbi:FAD-dependent oxidoreductase [Celeribacter litoreus]|uniref:FAD-dependent oxidoreductase n=1 Tax=Celeribacter litoreus TaxID=2876714 RepID=UPI001CCD8314|nr:FAD-dependent oxidoreductase [Celeribacter litoreus]MCA0044879.1 FAD-dependent oxidoreductase [Celeribacter litoreus]